LRFFKDHNYPYGKLESVKVNQGESSGQFYLSYGGNANLTIMVELNNHSEFVGFEVDMMSVPIMKVGKQEEVDWS
jgi:hypothetical protein